jgi:serine/threonine protein kinase/Tol biopolymer transport system component
MTPERWRRIEPILEQALDYSVPEHRAAFLSKACAGDEELRREIEAIIAGYRETDGLLSTLDLDDNIFTLANDVADPLIGQQIGAYRILSELGRGGMGTVYLAERADRAFHRRVAIKLIKRGMDTDFILKRFRHERQILATLDHPHIARLLDGGSTQSGLPYFVMELVEGAPIKAHCQGGNLSVAERLRLFQQVCDAVQYAHAKGIVHRDLKPSNILVTKEGAVKLLDFGIAKLLNPELAAGDFVTAGALDSTATAMRLMTPQYASPEQVRGQRVSPASDVYSLGVVLYELLTGAHPHHSHPDWPQEMPRIICDEEPEPMSVAVAGAQLSSPPPDRLSQELVGNLDYIVGRAMRKAVAERYPSAAEFSADIARHLTGERIAARPSPAPATGQTPTPATQKASLFSRLRTRLFCWRALVTFLTLAILAASIKIYQLRMANNATARSGAMSVAKITTRGQATKADISPDGQWIAYVSNEGGESLWLRPADAADSIQLASSSGAAYGSIAFSADSKAVYYVLLDANQQAGALYCVPITGGVGAKVLDDVAGKISFSPDGRRFAFLRQQHDADEGWIMIANAANGAGTGGNAPQTLARIGLADNYVNLAWSPDGRTIAANHRVKDQQGTYDKVVEYRLDSGAERALSTHRFGSIFGLAWQPDGAALYVVARESIEAYGAQIWRLTRGGGAPERVTNDVRSYVGAGITRTGQLITVARSYHSQIWLVPVAAPQRAVALPSNDMAGIYGLAWTPDGKLIYAALNNQIVDLWMMNADGSEQRQLTAHAANNLLPAVSPDGRQILFISDRSGGENHVWQMDIGGRNARELTQVESDQEPQFWPDGKRFVFGEMAGSVTVAKQMQVEGGSVQTIGAATGLSPTISPDGRRLAYLQVKDTGASPVIITLDGSAAPQTLGPTLPLSQYNPYAYLLRWTPDGRALSWVGLENNIANIYKLSLNGGAPQQLTHFNAERIYYFAWSPNGKTLALARGLVNSDVVLFNAASD